MRIDEYRGVTSRSVRSVIIGLAAGTCVGTALVGCSGGDPKGSATLEPGAFRSADEPAPPPLAAKPVKTATVNDAAAGFLDLTSLPGAPSTASPAVTPVGNAVVIDQFIGQINGRAMMASDFFGDGFGDRLRAMGRDDKYVKNPAEWMRETQKLVGQRLGDKVRNALLLDEVYSAMDPEVRQQGLRFAMEQLKGKIVSDNEGSTALTDERMRQDKGMTLDEFIADRRDILLMNDLLETKVRSRVNISWQQVKDAHERMLQEAQKNRMAIFSLISVSERDSQAVGEITGRLASGTPFTEVRDSELNAFEIDGRRYVQVPVKGDLANTVIVGIPELNAKAQKLSVGETAGPVAFNSALFWIHFDGEKMPDVKPLYDAQLEIIEQLRNAGSARESGKYIGQLIEKSSRTPIEKMEERLLAIAVSRYAPQGIRPAQPGGPAARPGRP